MYWLRTLSFVAFTFLIRSGYCHDRNQKTIAAYNSDAETIHGSRSDTRGVISEPETYAQASIEAIRVFFSFFHQFISLLPLHQSLHVSSHRVYRPQTNSCSIH